MGGIGPGARQGINLKRSRSIMSHSSPRAFAQRRPFRLRSLAAVLNRLNDLPDDGPIGPNVADWCRREDVFFEPFLPVNQVRKELLSAVFSEVPALALS